MFQPCIVNLVKSMGVHGAFRRSCALVMLVISHNVKGPEIYPQHRRYLTVSLELSIILPTMKGSLGNQESKAIFESVAEMSYFAAITTEEKCNNPGRGEFVRTPKLCELRQSLIFGLLQFTPRTPV